MRHRAHRGFRLDRGGASNLSRSTSPHSLLPPKLRIARVKKALPNSTELLRCHTAAGQSPDRETGFGRTGHCALRVNLYAGTENERSDAFSGIQVPVSLPQAVLTPLDTSRLRHVIWDPNNPGPSHWEQAQIGTGACVKSCSHSCQWTPAPAELGWERACPRCPPTLKHMDDPGYMHAISSTRGHLDLRPLGWGYWQMNERCMAAWSRLCLRYGKTATCTMGVGCLCCIAAGANALSGMA